MNEAVTVAAAMLDAARQRVAGPGASRFDKRTMLERGGNAERIPCARRIPRRRTRSDEERRRHGRKRRRRSDRRRARFEHDDVPVRHRPKHSSRVTASAAIAPAAVKKSKAKRRASKSTTAKKSTAKKRVKATAKRKPTTKPR